MSKKKKRHSAAPSSRTRSQGATLADEHSRSKKRMNPTARSFLIFDLVFLASCQMLYTQSMISDLVSGIATLIGFGLLMLALWFQFGKKDIEQSGRPGGPGSSGRWPTLK